jgi:nitrogen fixation NifU-like protein
MDNNLQQLYQKVVLEHTKQPKNFYKMTDPTVVGLDENPMCGDSYELFLRIDKDVIVEVSFQGAGCAISKSSASILTTQLKGKSKEEALRLTDKFYQLVYGEQSPEMLEEDLGELIAFAGITEFPTRIKCVVLAWKALQMALEKIND